MRQAKLVVMYSLEYYKFKFRKCLLVADKRLRSGLKTLKHIAPSCLLRLLCFLKFSLFLARVPFIVLYILSRPSPFCQFSPPLIFRPFSALPLLRAAPSPRRPFSAPSLLRAVPSSRRPSFSPSLSLCSLCPIRPLRPIRPIRAIRVQKKIIRFQKKNLSDSCANSPSKLSPALYKPRVKASAIPLKSRKTQIFSNFLSQSLAWFRKSPYFCTR